MNKERAGTDVLRVDHILQIPKQDKPISKEILDYATENGVIIDEVKDVIMDIIKNW